MSIFTKLKTATDFSASVIKEGFALIWPEKKSDGSVALQVKLEDGSVQEIGGGSAGDIDAAVRIYDATIDSDTGVVTITDGTPVSDLAIGDEIRTPDGVLKKVDNSTEVVSDPYTGDIQVMGFTNPTAANGLYKFQSDRKWKHASANYWITTSGNAWVISSLEAPPAPSAGLCYSETADEEMPYEVTSWQRVSSYGTPLLYPAAVTAIVSGITSDQTANGKYLPTGNAYEWKHETEDWWITLYSRGTMNYPCIANTPNPTGDILSSSEYVATYTVFVLPWNVPTWSRSGSTVVEMGDANIVVTDNVSLFEYAAFPKDGAKTSDITDDIATHNQNPSAHPDKLPLSGGQMTGGLKINATNALRINNGDYGVFLRKDASSFYIMVTAQGDPDGIFTDARPLRIDLATGVCSINGAATTDSLGNVITTTYAQLNHPTFSNGLEITGTTPYIDFHYNNSESDYTFRIVQNSEDTLMLAGKVIVGGTLTVTSGGMSVAGNIKNTGEIQSETSNSYRLVYGDYGTFWRNDGRDLYLMLTNSGDQYGVYNSFRPLTVDLATGICDISGSALETEYYLSSTGVYPRVSMNTTATADFNTFKTQGNYWFAFGVRPNGPLGDAAETTGVLSVYNIQNTHMMQVYNVYSGTGMSTQQMYYRWCYNNTWTSWARVTTAESIGTTTNDYNILTEPGDYYLSFGDNSSNVNAPANGPFHVMVHRYQNSAGTAKPILQIAASQIVSDAQTPMMFFRTASYSDGSYTFIPWVKLLTEKNVTYNTGIAGGSLTKNDYIKIGNVIIYIGSVNLRLNSGTTFALPVLSNNMTFVASCNTYVSTITMLDIYLDSNNRLNIDIRGTRSESATDDQVNVGWIGIGYLN